MFTYLNISWWKILPLHGKGSFSKLYFKHLSISDHVTSFHLISSPGEPKYPSRSKLYSGQCPIGQSRCCSYLSMLCHASILTAGHFVFALPHFFIGDDEAFLSFLFFSSSGVGWWWEFISCEGWEETSLTSWFFLLAFYLGKEEYSYLGIWRPYFVERNTRASEFKVYLVEVLWRRIILLTPFWVILIKEFEGISLMIIIADWGVLGLYIMRSTSLGFDGRCMGTQDRWVLV